MSWLDEYRTRVHNCVACPLTEQCKAPVPGKGDHRADIMFIGEAPGYHEDRTNQPFVGMAGKEFDGYLQMARLKRDEVWVDNTIKCRPGNNQDPPAESIAACRPHLIDAIFECVPEIICCLGAVATKAILGEGYDLESWHGIPVAHRIHTEGDYIDCTVLPMYHPALGLHTTDSMVHIQNDFKNLRQIVAGTYDIVEDEHTKPVYNWASPEGLLVDLADAKIIALDTETAEGKAWCLSLAVEPGIATVIKSEDTLCLKFLQHYVSQEDVLVLLHNSMFDLDVLREMGIVPRNVVDTMVMAYLLQDQPQGLKPLAFRLAGMEMTDYWDVIGDATQARAEAYLGQVARRTWTPPEPILTQTPEGEWKFKKPQALQVKAKRALKDLAKRRYVLEMIEILRTHEWDKGTQAFVAQRWDKDLMKDTKNKKGEMPESLLATQELLLDKLNRCPQVDLYSRWKNWVDADEHIEAEAALGKLWPGHLGDVDPQKAVSYAARDADATLRVYPVLRDLLEDRGLLGVLTMDMDTLPMIEDMQKGGWPIDAKFFSQLTSKFEKEMEKIEDQIEECLGTERGKLNPGSPKQVQQLLFTELGLKNPTRKKSKITGEDSAADDVLIAMMGYHPVIPLISKWRKFAKLISTYTVPLPKKMDRQGRVHPNIRITRTRTGRLSCSNPNLQNIPTRTEEGTQVRQGFICDKGCTLVSGDYSGIEMRIAAHLGNDKEMLGIFNAGLDVHAQTASKIFGIPVDRLDKKKHRYPAKTVGFLTLFGGGKETLLQKLIEKGCEGWTLDRCGDLLADWFKLYNGIDRHVQAVRAEARRKGYVSDMFGRIRLIPQVKSQIGYVREEGDRFAYSMAIQGSAQGVIKTAMGDLIPIYRGFKELGYTCDPLIQIHDDLVFHVQEEIRDSFMRMYKLVLEGVVQIGCPLKVDMAYGPTWASMGSEQ